MVIATETPPPADFTNHETWVIFPKSKAEEMQIATWASPEGGFETYWTPTQEEILRLEGQLGDYLRQNADQFFRHSTVWEQLDEYQRQYVGLVVDGKRLIYGNFFCSEMDQWMQEWVIVLDGGDCFFQVTYDLENGEFIRLQVNGEA